MAVGIIKGQLHCSVKIAEQMLSNNDHNLQIGHISDHCQETVLTDVKRNTQ